MRLGSRYERAVRKLERLATLWNLALVLAVASGFLTGMLSEFFVLYPLRRWLQLFFAMTCSSLHAAVNVRDFGAVGDGKTDDTAAINSALDVGEPVLIPRGEYLVNPLVGIKCRSGSRLSVAPQAVLRAIPTDSGSSRIIQVYDCSDVVIQGGTLIGEREQHLGTDSEWGMGVDVRASKNVTIRNVDISECWGDGIYLADVVGVQIHDLKCTHNRRQGLSIVGGSDITVRGSVFTRTEGTKPSSGIAIEPNEGRTVKRVRIVNCKCSNNNGRGISVSVPNALVGSSVVSDVDIDSTEVTGNGCDIPSFGVEVSNTSRVRVRNCRVSDNLGIGIGNIRARETTIISCTVTGTVLTENPSDAGVLFSEDDGCELLNCRIVDNETPGMFFHRTNVKARSNVVVRNRSKN